MKKALTCCFFLSFVCFLFAQIKPASNTDPWKIIQFAQQSFDQKNYGRAVRYAEEAKKIKREEITWALQVLNQALRPQEVRRQGDSLRDVFDVLQLRDSIDALEVLNTMLARKDFDDFDNSVEQLLALLENSFNFPEADFLLGKIYIFEGEYDLAKRYLTTAWEFSFLLDIPDQQLDILYNLAYLAQLTNDLDFFEKTLLLIIASDTLFSVDGRNSYFMTAVVQNLLRGITTEKFFAFYRHDAFQTISAHFQLAEYYYSLNNYALALQHASMASIISYTRLFQIMQERNYEFEMTTFPSFLNMLNQYPDIIEWASENEIWKGFYLFSQILWEMEKTEMSLELLSYLGTACPEDYWRSIALRHLINQQ
ncbi:MAG: tetratricopeptide repeat protein [Treponemataceae bacterium]